MSKTEKKNSISTIFLKGSGHKDAIIVNKLSCQHSKPQRCPIKRRFVYINEPTTETKIFANLLIGFGFETVSMATYCYYIGLLHELSDPIPLRHNFIYIFLCYETQEYENETKQHKKEKKKKFC